jgi:hypothetical protein
MMKTCVAIGNRQFFESRSEEERFDGLNSKFKQEEIFHQFPLLILAFSTSN